MRWSVFGLGALFVLLHGFVLPPHGFFCGDQGAKFLQARAFAEHGPFRPGIDVRSADIDPEYRYQEPILRNQQGRLVAAFSWLLPMLTAPFLAVLGLRGLYVVPALSALVIFMAAARLGRSPEDRSGLWTAWTVMLTAPVILYGSELWEHAPAAAAVVAAAVLLAPRRMPDAGNRMPQAGAGRLSYVAAGALIGVGTLFREEALLALPAFAAARAACVERDRVKELVRTGAWGLAGAGAVFLASVPVNLLVYGTALPLHLTNEVGKASSFLEMRRHIMADLLLPGSHAALFVVAALAGMAAAAAETLRRRRAAGGPDSTSRALLMITHLSVLTLVAIGVVFPLWRQIAHGALPFSAYRVTSAAHTWPFCFALLYWPWLDLYWPWLDNAAFPKASARFLLVSGLLLLAGTLAIVPSSGGAQWSPRYLFAAAPLFAIVAASMAVRRPDLRRSAEAVPAKAEGLRPGGARGHVVWMTRAILIASAVMQIGGFLYLGGAKMRNARLTDVLAYRTAPGDVLVTDLYAFPEVTATLAPTRRMLFSWSAADIPAMARLASERGIPRFGIVTSPVTGYEAPDAIDLPIARAPGPGEAAPTCRFMRRARPQLDELGLTLNRYSCEPP